MIGFNNKFLLRREDASLKFLKLSTVILLLLVLGSPTVMATTEEVIAIVNGQEITTDQFYQRLESEAGAIILNQMIIETILFQKQAETNIEVTDEDLSEALIEIVTQLGGFEGLQQYLYQTGMTENDLLEQLELNILISKLARSEVEVTDAEIEAWFHENKEFFNNQEEVEASHILVDTESEANDLLAQLEAGADFGELARTKSQDPGSAIRNGDLGFFGRGVMVQPFEEVAFSLGIDELGVAKSDFGWHIIKVTDRQEASEATLEESWEIAKLTLIEYKSSDPYEYFEKLLDTAEIEVFR